MNMGMSAVDLLQVVVVTIAFALVLAIGLVVAALSQMTSQAIAFLSRLAIFGMMTFLKIVLAAVPVPLVVPTVLLGPVSQDLQSLVVDLAQSRQIMLTTNPSTILTPILISDSFDRY
jgi:hypothetical protein